jgi:predicted polyphosphate/ATP-dependent NAD kinase
VKKLGLIVNPLAGIGGRVALKGSDGEDVVHRALELGAVPLSPQRSIEALHRLSPIRDQFELVTYPYEMGQIEAKECDFNPKVLGHIERDHTTAEDTKRAAKEMRAEGPDLILFAGGDGTARDIYDSVDPSIPVIGIPTGCKIHSGVYAATPAAAGELAMLYLTGAIAKTTELEVMDIDEVAFRSGVVRARLYGYLKVPNDRRFTQGAKAGAAAGSDEYFTHAIADRIVSAMKPGRLYVIGSGTTTRAIMEELRLPNTLLGIDVVLDKKLVASDVTEKQLLELVDGREAEIIVTPIGGQGYIFGRGNQQLSPEVIKAVGPENIRVIATANKIHTLPDQKMRVDTGDQEVDQMLRGHRRVMTSYSELIVLEVI